jgi:GNAT superfamily N-acetyltransferase
VTDPVAVRRVRADEWERVKSLRAEAVRDPDAAIAFLDTPESIAARDDEFWRDRTTRAAESDEGAQFVADAGGEWIGSLTVLLRRVGGLDHLGRPVETPRADVVGVYVRPSHRGSGVIDALFAAAVEWACARGMATIELDVHVDNARARAAYRRAGFNDTGGTFDGPVGTEVQMRRSCGQ